MKIEFIASLGVIAADPTEEPRTLCQDALGLPLEASEGDDYFHSERVGGTKHFGVWPLTCRLRRPASEAPTGPRGRPVPKSPSSSRSPDADAGCKPRPKSCRRRASSCCTRRGTEPWGQTVARLQSIEGCGHRHLLRAVDARRGLTQGAL